MNLEEAMMSLAEKWRQDCEFDDKSSKLSINQDIKKFHACSSAIRRSCIKELLGTIRPPASPPKESCLSSSTT